LLLEIQVVRNQEQVVDSQGIDPVVVVGWMDKVKVLVGKLLVLADKHQVHLLADKLQVHLLADKLQKQEQGIQGLMGDMHCLEAVVLVVGILEGRSMVEALEEVDLPQEDSLDQADMGYEALRDMMICRLDKVALWQVDNQELTVLLEDQRDALGRP